MKKSKFTRAAAAFLAVIAIATSAASCKKQGDSGDESESTGGSESVVNETVINYEKADAMLPESIATAGVNIVENGKSDYKIVVPENADAIISFAASETQNFIKDSTGVTIPVVSDSGLDFDETA